MPSELQPTNALMPSGLGLFLTNCFTGTLPVKGTICSPMLFSSSGSKLKHQLLTASRIGTTFQNLILMGSLGAFESVTCSTARSLKNRLQVIASEIVGIFMSSYQYIRTRGNLRSAMCIIIPKKLISFGVALSSSPSLCRACMLVM